jgi:UDP-GlcNAc:undecaprenyl-phosphate GlcNAc-1-phosphate transferase
VFSSALVVFLTGLLDDLIGLKPGEKLLGQTAAAGLAWSAGVSIHGVAGYAIGDWWSLPVTLLWLIGCSNAFNLIDGVDGLAAGVGLFAVLTIFVAGLLENNAATIFLGDSGSLTIGFLLGCYGVIWSQKSATILGMTAPLMALSVPLLDTLLAIVRRLLRGQPLFTADRGHIHHRLLERGLSPRRVALVLYGVCGLAAALSLLQSVVQNRFAGLVIVVFCAAAWIGVQHLGYVELQVARRVISRRNYLGVLRAQLALQKLECVLSGRETVEDCWAAVVDACRELGYEEICLCTGRERWAVRGDIGGAFWYALIPLSSGVVLRLAGRADGTQPGLAPGLVAESLRRGLAAKLQEPQGAPSARACEHPALARSVSR